ncbi:MAG: hypothetical protein IJX52_03520 [Oscillibacter sp.]|nr:hypothetical protein [Oscillibacter sp.]
MSCGGSSCSGGCCGSCGSCGGRELWVTPGEVELLERFAQYAFLPVARKWDSETPVYLEDGAEKAVLWGDLLTAMQFKGLISIDYDMPLSGFDYAGYDAYPCRGSMALTAEGQRAVELLEIQGAEE